MNTQPDHNPDEDGWCQNDGCMWNSWNAKSDPPCPTKLPKRAGTIQEQEELLHGRPPEPTGNAGELEQHIRFIVDELGSTGNDMWHDESTDWLTAKIMERIAAHDRARLDAVLEAIGDDDELGPDGLRRSDGATMNNLRAKLRTAVKAIFKMEDGK